jgi:hypothetical protein
MSAQLFFSLGVILGAGLAAVVFLLFDEGSMPDDCPCRNKEKQDYRRKF